MTDENETIRKKANLFFASRTMVHISMKNFHFYNGIITDIHEEFLVIGDEGIGDVPVFFSEITHIEPYREIE